MTRLRNTIKYQAGIKSLIGAFLCLGVILMAGLSQKSLAAEQIPRLGIALPSFRETRWQGDFEHLREHAKKAGAGILVRFAGNDPAQQVIQIKELVTLGVDVLIVTPTDSHIVAEAIEFAKKRGIIVIAYDRFCKNSALDAFITFEQRQVGELMGKYLAEVAPEGNYVIVKGPSSDENSRLFFEGAMDYLEPLIASGKITVLEQGTATDWRADAAAKVVEKALAKSRSIRAVLTPNDDTAAAAILVLSRFGLDGKVFVTGQDATPEALERIFRGTQAMTVFKNQDQLARVAIETAIALYRGEAFHESYSTFNEKIEVPTVALPVYFISKKELPWLKKLLKR